MFRFPRRFYVSLPEKAPSSLSAKSIRSYVKLLSDRLDMTGFRAVNQVGGLENTYHAATSAEIGKSGPWQPMKTSAVYLR